MNHLSARRATKEDLMTTLRRLPLFTDLSETQLAGVAARASVQRYEQGEIVFSQGDPCGELFVVKEGIVKVFKIAANGRQQLLGIERAGNSLAEIPVFDGDSYPVAAQAATATVLLRLDAAVFRAFCLQHPEVAMKVIKVLAHRLRRMGSLVEDLSFVSVRGRLVAYIVELAEKRGKNTFQSMEVELTENNEELAARLGTVRELISRNLGRLHNEGLMEIKRRKVIIPDLVRLKAEICRSR